MKKKFSRRLLYTLLTLIDDIFLLIPYDMALRTGRFFGFMSYLVLSKYRRLTKDHLKIAFGDSMSPDEINRVAKDVFINLGMNAAEILSIPKMKNRLQSIITVEGIDKIDNALKKGRGAVVISAHLGNWELIPMYFASRGYPSNVIARPLYYEKYNEWVAFLRSSMGVNVILRTDSPRKVIEVLKKNELLGIIPDQDIDSIDGVFVDFFNKKAYTPVAPVKIAMATKAPMIPMFIIRKQNRHIIVVDDPIEVEEGKDKELAVLEYTQRWSGVLESYIRRYPHLWVWMHKRWKTKAHSMASTRQADG